MRSVSFLFVGGTGQLVKVIGLDKRVCAKKRKTTRKMDPCANEQCRKKPGRPIKELAQNRTEWKILVHDVSQYRSRPNGRR